MMSVAAAETGTGSSSTLESSILPSSLLASSFKSALVFREQFEVVRSDREAIVVVFEMEFEKPERPLEYVVAVLEDLFVILSNLS
jgi:hypothetical protein